MKAVPYAMRVGFGCVASVTLATVSRALSIERRRYKVGYVTDVEGHLAHWERYLSMSAVLDRDANGRPTLREGCGFVYGGDAVDRGAGDLRVLTDLLDLKRRWPDRVHLVLGNRDINKMRLKTELSDRFIAENGEDGATPYWVQGVAHLAPSAMGFDFSLGRIADRIRWIARATMGAPVAFDKRREELGADATDEDVALSFRRLVEPGGAMEELLSKGELAVAMGDVLFVHGGIPPAAAGWLPPREHEKDPRRWVERLNAFARREVQAWRDAPPQTKAWSVAGGYGTGLPGGNLMAYGMGWLPDRSRNPTTVYANWLSGGAPQRPHAEVAAYLSREFRYVLSGHQPHGDCPLVLRGDGVSVITADTSYSRNVRWEDGHDGGAAPASALEETRGVACAEVVVHFGGPAGSVAEAVEIHGTLSNGEAYGFRLDDPAAAGVGAEAEDGWWVKAVLPNGDRVHCRSQGYEVVNRVVKGP